ncbi:MAG TPA: MmgE/PrpD family protein [candidate division Zixibacteria bacterium]|nr:MmgE/PrpD family protein [candidate division Zixibacteria bacterium]
MAQNGVARRLAEFIVGIDYDDLPEGVVSKAKELILDQLGVALASSMLPWNRKVLEYAREIGASGASTVIGTDYRTSLEYAALVNGTFGHGFELDDYCTPCGAHVGCVVIPAALALGEQAGATGRDFLTAVALGAEIVLRVGFALTVRGIAARGFHSTSVYGPFGAVASSVKLLGLSEDAATHAIGIAGSHASGTTEYDQTGGDIKRLHAGIAGMAGIRAALLAKRNFTAPPTIFEGKNGILNAFSSSPEPGKLTENLRGDYFMLKTRIKPYACCGAIIPQIDALREILRDHPVDHRRVKGITVGVENRALSHVGTVGPRPRDITGAQFSSHFSLGLTLVKGRNDFGAYFEALKGDFSDPEVVAAAEKVSVVHDDEAEEIYPRTRLGKVTVETTDGQQYQAKVFHPKGSPENPLGCEELREKFLSLSTMVLSEARAQELLRSLEDLENLRDLRSLSALLAAPGQ